MVKNKDMNNGNMYMHLCHHFALRYYFVWLLCIYYRVSGDLHAAGEELSNLMDDNVNTKFDMTGSNAMSNTDNASEYQVYKIISHKNQWQDWSRI